MENNTSTRLNAKLLEDKLKVGWGTPEFAERLGIVPEELENVLQKAFHGKALSAYIKRIRENDRRNVKIAQQTLNKAKKSREKSLQNPTVLPEELQATSSELCEEPQLSSGEVSKEPQSEEVANTSTEEEEVFTEEDQLKFLLIELEEDKNMIIDYENDHKSLISERKEIRKKLLVIKEEIEKLKSELKEKLEEISRLDAANNQLNLEIQTVNVNLTQAREIMAETERKIEILQKITVNILEASIEPEFEIPETWTKIREEWLDDEDFECLTMTEFKLLAKAVALRTALVEQKKNFEFCFVSDKLRELFYKKVGN